jgi:hypothetical protein
LPLALAVGQFRSGLAQVIEENRRDPLMRPTHPFSDRLDDRAAGIRESCGSAKDRDENRRKIFVFTEM